MAPAPLPCAQRGRAAGARHAVRHPAGHSRDGRKSVPQTWADRPGLPASHHTIRGPRGVPTGTPDSRSRPEATQPATVTTRPLRAGTPGSTGQQQESSGSPHRSPGPYRPRERTSRREEKPGRARRSPAGRTLGKPTDPPPEAYGRPPQPEEPEPGGTRSIPQGPRAAPTTVPTDERWVAAQRHRQPGASHHRGVKRRGQTRLTPPRTRGRAPAAPSAADRGPTPSGPSGDRPIGVPDGDP